MGAIVLSQIPDTNTSTTVARDDLALVWMNDNILDWATMRVATLNGTSTSLPDFDSAILRACNHPFSLTVERNTSDISSMAFEGEKWVRVGGLDIIQLDSMMTSGGQELLVRRDRETIDLRVRVLNSARADTRQSLPEADDVSFRQWLWRGYSRTYRIVWS